MLLLLHAVCSVFCLQICTQLTKQITEILKWHQRVDLKKNKFLHIFKEIKDIRNSCSPLKLSKYLNQNLTKCTKSNFPAGVINWAKSIILTDCCVVPPPYLLKLNCEVLTGSDKSTCRQQTHPLKAELASIISSVPLLFLAFFYFKKSIADPLGLCSGIFPKHFQTLTSIVKMVFKQLPPTNY